MPSGGSRKGAGRKPLEPTAREMFRRICREPEFEALIRKRAFEDADFALKCFEHGYGRPPQALKIEGGEAPVLVHSVQLSDGSALSPAAAGIPAANPDEHSKG
jgi:hypothetical protein